MDALNHLNYLNNVTEDPAMYRPQWSCRYCGVSDPVSVVKCIETGFWFCNGSHGTSASHIIHHLVKSKSKSIQLHPQSALGDTIVECYNCNNKNLFMMGFIPAKGEALVVLLCRNCLHLGALKELGWSLDAWTPLIADRELVDWMVHIPDPNISKSFVPALTTLLANKLEDLWRANPMATLADLERNDIQDVAEHVRKVYEDGYHYQAIFEPLIKFEADYDKEVKASLSEDNVSVKWKSSDASKRVTALFVFSAASSENLRITLGDELSLALERKRWRATGTVLKIEDDGEITLDLGHLKAVPSNVADGYHVSFVWKPVSFERMQKALTTFATDDKSVSGYLYHKILGHEVQDQLLMSQDMDVYNIPNLPPLNESQKLAVRQVLRKPLALIQGPPGTGKTVTCAAIVYCLVQQNVKGEMILVTAPSNVAVDQLTNKIRQTGVRVVRVTAKSREHLDSDVKGLSLHEIIQTIDSVQGNRFKELMEKKENPDKQLNRSEQKEFLILRKKLEKETLRAAQVVCCTCSGAGDVRLKGLKFRQVLLDEATQATEPESLIPLVHGCKHFVLVGDHCQLGPVVMCKKAANAGLNSSLFERLVQLGLRPIRLQVQYRMHPCLSRFPSNTFYEGSLINGVSEKDRIYVPRAKSGDAPYFTWPNPDKPMMFLSCLGSEEIGGTGTSYLNRTEASQCEKIVTALLDGGVHPKEIGVVTPYEGQRAYIVLQMQRHGSHKVSVYKQVEVSSVDAFQGREKPFIILSCVRSNEKQGIGFLNDPRRLNVAITRAKYGLFVLGNPRVLAKRALWNTLILHFQEQKLLVEGKILSLRNCNISLVPKKFSNVRQRIFTANAATSFSGDRFDPYGDKNAVLAIAPVNDSRFDKRYGGSKHQTEPDLGQEEQLSEPPPYEGDLKEDKTETFAGKEEVLSRGGFDTDLLSQPHFDFDGLSLGGKSDTDFLAFGQRQGADLKSQVFDDVAAK